jgi:hypothetical protein
MQTLLFGFDWKKLFMMNFKVEISHEFLACVDSQLTALFEQQTGITIAGRKIRLSWQYDKPLNYQKGTISKMDATIWLTHGSIRVSILWESRNGKIYDIADTTIICDDIHFWFEGLDADKCRYLVNPKWTLIALKDLYKEVFEKRRGLLISESFIDCADKQLSAIFEKQTGIKPSKHVCLIWDAYGDNFYHKGDISVLTLGISVNAHHNNVIIYWTSASGRVYDLNDTGIDCSDIRFGFEELDAVEYHKQLYPHQTLPFKLKGLTYELVVVRLNVDITITMNLKEEKQGQVNIMTEGIDEFIDGFNTRSLKLDRKYGIVHNWNHSATGDALVYEIDTGSAGAEFYKKLLRFLSKMEKFRKIEIS